MYTESLDKVKFVIATVKPHESQSDVLRAIEDCYGHNDFVLRLNFGESQNSKTYLYSCHDSKYKLLSESNYSKWIRADDLIDELAKCSAFRIVINSAGENIYDIINKLPYKYLEEV